MCAEFEREFSFRQYWGSENKRCHVEYRRDRNTYCIYCGKEADTREHSPSKVFLRKPYPDDLPILPACKSCNNAFSDDELYSEVYIDALKYLSGYADSMTDENKNRLYKSAAFYDAQCDYMNYVTNGKIKIPDKLKKILIKLSLCHVVYELSQGYSTGDRDIELSDITYKYRLNSNMKEINEFSMPVDLSDKVLPELGSRIFENIRVLEPILSPLKGGEKTKISLTIMLWTIIQENNYEYLTWIEKEMIHVKIAIHDFVFVYVKYAMR